MILRDNLDLVGSTVLTERLNSTSLSCMNECPKFSPGEDVSPRAALIQAISLHQISNQQESLIQPYETLDLHHSKKIVLSMFVVIHFFSLNSATVECGILHSHLIIYFKNTRSMSRYDLNLLYCATLVNDNLSRRS